MILVTGGSSSGKSAYAEKLFLEIPDADAKYYIATMQVGDEESRARVEKHRKMRKGKGFLTIEQPTDLLQALDKISGPGSKDKGKNCALLECMSNLTANEMFRKEPAGTAETEAEKIVGQVKELDSNLEHMIVVTNNVFEDGVAYDPYTTEYLRALGLINRRLAAMAERVVEVVAGIPVEVKSP